MAVVAVAENDDPDAAWAKCLTAMLVAQQMNNPAEQAVFGSISGGEFWFFGKLAGKTLHQDPRSFTLTRLDELFGALNAVFQQTTQRAHAVPTGG